MLKVSLVYSNSPKSLAIQDKISTNHQFVDLADCDFIVVLGGDGFMLHTLHSLGHLQKPFYGINTGTVGFLMNTYQPGNNLYDLIQKSVQCSLNQLDVKFTNIDGATQTTKAINEIYLLRESGQAAHIKVTINNNLKIAKLVGDGIIVATPAGSTAYNFSANGPIIPLGTPLLAMTPISAFRPRSWKGALLPNNVNITLEVLEPIYRPVNLYADIVKFSNIQQVNISNNQTAPINILFDPGHNLEERTINEQFIAN